MLDAIPEPVFPEEDPYPAYRAPTPIVADKPKRSPIDDYVLSALVATGTQLVPRKPIVRRATEL
jgi:hypothetical protein